MAWSVSGTVVLRNGGTPVANSMLTMLHMLGRDDMQQFGDSTGELDLNNASVPATTEAPASKG